LFLKGTSRESSREKSIGEPEEIPEKGREGPGRKKAPKKQKEKLFKKNEKGILGSGGSSINF